MTTTEKPADVSGVALTAGLAWPLGAKLHLLAGRGVPNWLHSFAGYVTKIGRRRYKVRVPVDDDKERWVPARQLQQTDPWAR